MDIKDHLNKATKDDSLLEELDKIYRENKDERELIYESLISLHNNDEVDILDEFQQVKSDLECINFYSIQHILQEILPKLNAPMEDIVSCIVHFIKEARSPDLIFSAFTKYCEADNERPKKVLEIEIAEYSSEFIFSAILAGAKQDLTEYLNVSINLLTKEDQETIRIVILAIGRIDYHSNKVEIHRAFAALKKLVSLGFYNQNFSAILTSSFYLYLQDNDLDSDVTELATTILASKEEQIIIAASQLFGFKSCHLPDALLDLILKSLESLNAENKTALANIGHGLVDLLKTDKQEKAYTLLDSLLINNEENLKLENFDFLFSELSTKGELRNKVITRWLISKKTPLCQAASDLIRQSYAKDIELKIDKSALSVHSKIDFVFISRKAIGWFPSNPVSSASFIVSFLNNVDENESKQILSAVFEFLLINYSGKVRKYFESTIKDQSTKVQEMLTNLLSNLDEYISGLDDTLNIQELLPTQAHRESYSRYKNRVMTKAYKEAEKTSFLGDLFTKQVLLYGNKSIHYMYGMGGDQPTRVETPLGSHQTSIEVARLNHIDPHGYDYWMHVFRYEGCS